MKCLSLVLSLLWFGIMPQIGKSQGHSLKGKVTSATDDQALQSVLIQLPALKKGCLSNAQGEFELTDIPAGNWEMVVSYPSFDSIRQQILVPQTAPLQLSLSPMSFLLAEVNIEEEEAGFALVRLRDVSGSGIYAGRKTEVVQMDQLTANLAANNSRQVFARIAGLNIWESDCGGLQLGIGGRGLSPNRTSHFNTRFNGYDMSADALGYPESYFSPPMQAVDRVEIVRGAASLQYGTQFGGMANFVIKEGPKDQALQFTTTQSLGSYGFYSSFISVGGTKGKVNYYAYHQYRRGSCFRPNSDYAAHNAYASVQWEASSRLKLRLDYTHMNYLAQQAGGLTDAEFARDPALSTRNRNYFSVFWNLAAFTVDFQLSPQTSLNSRTFGLYGGRQALGYRGPATSLDPIELAQAPEYARERDLMKGLFQNVGHETRLLHRYGWRELPQTLLVGARLYHGFNHSEQGYGNSGSDADFTFLRQEEIGQSDYRFPSWNGSLFAEHIFRLSEKLSLTPGLRWEYIRTEALGRYRETLRDLADNLIFDRVYEDNRLSERNLLLAGLGLGYELTPQAELYANVSQNYRSISFTDFREANPSFAVDPDLQDERGFNADLGIRGSRKQIFTYELTAFFLAYQDRIGTVQRVNQETFSVFQFRTNVSDAYTVGLETYAELDWWKWWRGEDARLSWRFFSNLALLNARYVNSEDPALQNKLVEMVPRMVWRAGTEWEIRNFSASLLGSYVSDQFTDATNAVQDASAVVGVVPAYVVADLSTAYQWRFLRLEAGVNNILNASYFTRRATGYPGPGIIPADPRTGYVSVGVQW